MTETMESIGPSSKVGSGTKFEPTAQVMPATTGIKRRWRGGSPTGAQVAASGGPPSSGWQASVLCTQT